MAKIKNNKAPFDIDFGVDYVIMPRQEKRNIPTPLNDFAAPTVDFKIAQDGNLKNMIFVLKRIM